MKWQGVKVRHFSHLLQHRGFQQALWKCVCLRKTAALDGIEAASCSTIRRCLKFWYCSHQFQNSNPSFCLNLLQNSNPWYCPNSTRIQSSEIVIPVPELKAARLSLPVPECKAVRPQPYQVWNPEPLDCIFPESKALRLPVLARTSSKPQSVRLPIPSLEFKTGGMRFFIPVPDVQSRETSILASEFKPRDWRCQFWIRQLWRNETVRANSRTHWRLSVALIR